LLAFRYIAFHYIKYFIIILAALSAFMVGFDFMENSAHLPESANLVMIYVVYKTFYAIDMLLPLALVFSMIATKVHLIRSNALVAFYSIGYSKNDVLKPFVLVSIVVISIYIGLHTTAAFARANEFATNIERYWWSVWLVITTPCCDSRFNVVGKHGTSSHIVRSW